MIKKIICCAVQLILTVFIPDRVLSYNDTITHPAITEKASDSNNAKLDQYLKKSLGFKAGLATRFPSNNPQSTVIYWLKKGSIAEDAESCRRANHMHDPLKTWDKSYMNDTSWTNACNILWGNRYSNITWATGFLTPPPNGQKASFTKRPAYAPQNWDNAREYYYNALTQKSNVDREPYFAKTFQTVGQVMHLLQDMGVPAHTRNDFASHLIGEGPYWSDKRRQPYEYYVQNNTTLVTLATPVVPIFSNTKLTDFWDTDKYNGSNPSTLADIGLAEFSNANYFSDFTIYPNNAPTPEHTFPYPYIKESGIYGGYQICTDLPPAPEYGTDLYRKYISRKIKGSCSQITPERKVDHFAAVSLLDEGKTNLMSISSLRLWLDENVHKTYANELLPAAIGYSAKLLDYFFRGDIRLSYETSGNPGYVITNYTGEKLEGDFTLYYDTVKDERFPLWAGRGILEATMGDKTNTFDFIPPSDAKEPGKYIVVFKGKMGNEDGSVAGYVLTRRLEITPPSQYIYSMVDGSEADPYFTSINAKVKNASTSEQMQSGTLQAVAKYKSSTDDTDFIYSVSEPQTIDLSSNAPLEVEFNFDGDPIPVDVTDLYLQVIFKGKIGTEDGAIAIGGKDIREPTPIGIFNNMDRICIYGKWYEAGSQEAYNALPDSAKWWDYWPHDLGNVYIKVSPVNAPSDASPTNYTLLKSKIEPGELYQMYILSDYDFIYSDYGSMVGIDPDDNFIHDAAIKKEKTQGVGVRNQTEYSNDPTFCSTYGASTPCTVTRTSPLYLIRGVEMWGAGGFVVDGVSYPNYTDSGYIPCSWTTLQP